MKRKKNIPSTYVPLSAIPEELCSEEEDAHCSRLLFKDDFLSDQYFGENHPISILTEKVHFGEGMHRRAFRTKLKAGQIPLLVPGHSCVLKVHNAISYRTNNNDDLLQKNFHLAVEVKKKKTGFIVNGKYIIVLLLQEEKQVISCSSKLYRIHIPKSKIFSFLVFVVFKPVCKCFKSFSM